MLTSVPIHNLCVKTLIVSPGVPADLPAEQPGVRRAGRGRDHQEGAQHEGRGHRLTQTGIGNRGRLLVREKNNVQEQEYCIVLYYTVHNTVTAVFQGGVGVKSHNLI